MPIQNDPLPSELHPTSDIIEASSPMIYPTSSSNHPSSLQDNIATNNNILASPMHHPSSSLGQTPPLTATDLPSSVGRLFSSVNLQLDNQYINQSLRPARRHDLGTASRSLPMLQSAEQSNGDIDFLSSSGGLASSNGGLDSNDRVRVIWGTNIVIKEAVSQFKDFLLHFSLAHKILIDGIVTTDMDHDLEPFYPKLLRQLQLSGVSFLNLDGSHLKAYRATRSLYQQLLCHPQEIIPLMDMTVNELLNEILVPDSSIMNDILPIQVRPFNIERNVNMRNLSPSDVDQLITIKGLVIRSSPICPDMRAAYFRCANCDFSVSVENIKGKVAEPQKCPRSECGASHSMLLIHNRCSYSDKQFIKVQETPDVVPDGQTPHSVTVCVYDTLVDKARPGDRVELTGIFRVAQIRLNNHQRRIKNVFRTYVDIVHIKRTDSRRLRLVADCMRDEDLMVGNDAQDFASNRVSEDGESVLNQDSNVAELLSLSKTPDLYERLANSIAPSIWQLDTVKKSLLLQLFGGVSKSLEQAGHLRFRGDINVLLAGDPSVSKSQLLRAVHKLAPRGIYTSGKGSSAVGLTAYITRDPETGQLVLESGALVLSDGGLCCIDEFDKMSDATRAILHEVMEQQTVSVAKAGIITTLNARTAVLAAANPIDSKYNPNKSLVENLHLPPSLLSRFDIICLILDQPDEATDIQLARHILSLHVSTSDINHETLSKIPPIATIDLPLLARYISYARQHIQPILTEDAIRPLLDGYVAMRKVNTPGSSTGKSSGISNKTVSATTRQLESLIRLSEAHARMRLSRNVEREDVAEAIRLVKAAILAYALDPVTGRIDMDLINSGKGAAFRERAANLKSQISDFLAAKPAIPIEISVLQRELTSITGAGISDRLLRDVLQELLEEDVIHANGPLRQTTLIKKIS